LVFGPDLLFDLKPIYTTSRSATSQYHSLFMFRTASSLLFYFLFF